MADAPIIYADGFTCIDIVNGVARLPLFVMVKTDAGADHEQQIVGTLAIPLTAFVGMHRGISEMMDVLRERGAIMDGQEARPN